MIREQFGYVTKEDYYNGSRWGSLWKKITGNIPLRHHSSTFFTVDEIINHQPTSLGIVAYSLFGDGKVERFRKKLLNPLFQNAKKLKAMLPTWSGRIYICSSIPSHIKEELVQSGYELFVMPLPLSEEGYAWRFLAAEEGKPVVFHDADMLLDDKFLEIVTNWLSGDKLFLRRKLTGDNYIGVPISAGCWGVRPYNGKSPLWDIKKNLEKHVFEGFGSDEAFLTKEIWPIMKKEGYYSTQERWFVWIVPTICIIVFAMIVTWAIIWYRKRKIHS